jgi:hypothetical protein
MCETTAMLRKCCLTASTPSSVLQCLALTFAVCLRAAAAAGANAGAVVSGAKRQARLEQKSQRHRSAVEKTSLLSVETIYEGTGGKKSNKVPYRTTFIITNRAIEVEIEGANLVLSILTCGLWYMFFQSTTIEVVAQ